MKNMVPWPEQMEAFFSVRVEAQDLLIDISYTIIVICRKRWDIFVERKDLWNVDLEIWNICARPLAHMQARFQVLWLFLQALKTVTQNKSDQIVS